MEAKYRFLSSQYIHFINSQTNFERVVTPTQPHFGRLETTLFQLVNHVSNHSTYHRGNLSAMLRQAGHSGVSTDYVFYLFERQREGEKSSPWNNF
ncbi:DinB family protein [Paenibacillus xerothermodurans]